MLKTDKNTIAGDSQEIRLFCKIKNEITRLPYWFEYYRKLGVNRFFFIDDHSTDGTTDYLLMQPDCHVFNAEGSFRGANGGVAWQNELLDAYGQGHWTVVVDADELLAYKDHERVKLQEFCQRLEKEGADMLYTFLLDFYPADLSDAVCEPGEPFTEICNYFDSGYRFVPRFRALSRPGLQYPETEVIGGVRMRKFYPEQINTGLYNRIKNRLLWNGCNILGKAGVQFKDKPHHAPTLYKVPLVKWREGYARLSSHHITKPVNGFSEDTGVLMHFKFFADFHEKAKAAVKSGQYYSNNREYRRYLNYITQNPDPSFIYGGSVKYYNSGSLSQFFAIKPERNWLCSKGFHRFKAQRVTANPIDLDDYYQCTHCAEIK